MRSTTLIAAAFATAAFAVPTYSPIAGPEKLTKRMDIAHCGQFYDRRFVSPVNILTNDLIGAVLGDGTCQNLDNAGMNNTFTFELFPRCEWCRFWR
jgi:hypothetical protein